MYKKLCNWFHLFHYSQSLVKKPIPLKKAKIDPSNHTNSVAYYTKLASYSTKLVSDEPRLASDSTKSISDDTKLVSDSTRLISDKPGWVSDRPKSIATHQNPDNNLKISLSEEPPKA